VPEFHTDTQLSRSQSLTPEGFLLARDTVISRCGDQLYGAEELGGMVQDDGTGFVVVTRDTSEVFRSQAINSLNGKSITLGHPSDLVTPSNWAAHSIGIVTNPRRGAVDGVPCVLADLLFTAQRGIDAVRAGIRELSVGYDASYVSTGRGRARQCDIICNHVSLVREGRCGALCSVRDHAPRVARKAKPPSYRPRPHQQRAPATMSDAVRGRAYLLGRLEAERVQLKALAAQQKAFWQEHSHRG
jgi:hypothetical protein